MRSSSHTTNMSTPRAGSRHTANVFRQRTTVIVLLALAAYTLILVVTGIIPLARSYSSSLHEIAVQQFHAANQTTGHGGSHPEVDDAHDSSKHAGHEVDAEHSHSKQTPQSMWEDEHDELVHRQRSAYSWYHCTDNLAQKQIYGNEPALLPHSRACHFQSTCINVTSGNLVYFMPPELQPGDATIWQTHGEEFPQPLIDDWWEVWSPPWQRQASWPDTEGLKIGVEVRYEATPSEDDARWSKSAAMVYTDQIFTGNFGHILGDVTFPVWRLLRLFKLTHLTSHSAAHNGSDVEIRFQNRDCIDYTQYAEDCHLQEELGAYITSLPIRRLDRIYPPVEPASSLQNLICAPNVLVGTAHYYMTHGADIDGIFDEYVEHILQYHGHDVHHIPTQHKVLVFEKNGKRRITNSDAIADALRTVLSVEVEVVRIYEYSLAEQIAMVQNATLIISPCGGISFSAVFLPRNAAAIFTNYWVPEHHGQRKHSERMEGFIFNRFRRFHSLYYPSDPTDSMVEYPTTNGKEHDPGMWREFAVVTVNIEKIIQMARGALLRAEVGYGWQHPSFGLGKDKEQLYMGKVRAAEQPPAMDISAAITAASETKTEKKTEKSEHTPPKDDQPNTATEADKAAKGLA